MHWKNRTVMSQKKRNLKCVTKTTINNWEKYLPCIRLNEKEERYCQLPAHIALPLRADWMTSTNQLKTKKVQKNIR